MANCPQKKIMAIIPAKAVSKRLPGKNIKLLAGKPMIAYIIETARKVKYLDRIIVSTESPEIAEIAKKYGAQAPFLRPLELTKDEVPALAVIQHALKTLKEKENYQPDYVLLLYATSPLLKAERINQAIELALKNNADSVFTATLDKGHYWIEANGAWKRLYPIKQVNSQYQVPLAKENGALYLTKREILEKQYVADRADILMMAEGENIDIDELTDFAQVEKIILAQKI